MPGAWPPRDRSLQPDGARAGLATRSVSVSRRSRGRGRVLASPLPCAEHRPAAWGGRVREIDRGAEAAECSGIRSGLAVAATGPGHEYDRNLPAGIAGFAG